MSDRSLLALKIGTRIREIRYARKLSQTAMAKRVNVTSCEVSRAESGSRMPTLPTLLRFAKALCVDVGDLLDIEQSAIPAELAVLLADLRSAPRDVRKAALAQVNAHLDTLRAKPQEAKSPRVLAKAKRSGGGHVR